MPTEKPAPKLFDWKKSGAYSWKSAFPLTRLAPQEKPTPVSK